jgi:acyl carrier protein
MSDTASAILHIIEESVPGIQIDPAADGDRALSELGIDSLDKMTVLLGVQERWNLAFSEQEIAELNTFNAICKKVA